MKYSILMPHYNRAMGGDTRIGLVLKAFRLGRIFTKNPIKRIRAISQAFKAQKQYKKALILNEHELHKWENNSVYSEDMHGDDNTRKQIKIALV